MLFSSNEFLFLFLPLFLILYFVTPRNWRNLTLLLFSLIFYGWGEPIYLFLMIFTIAVNYLFGYLVFRSSGNPSAKRGNLIAAIAVDLLILGFFKYADFVIVSLSQIPIFSDLKPLGIALPIGISFYIFQSMSYVIDVYRGDAQVQRNAVSFGAYVTMFPQLIAGPIVRYSDIDRELNGRRVTLDGVAEGAKRFICGLTKKVLLANTSGALWESIKAIPAGQGSVVLYWLGLASFASQIYFDFSGYSDMGIGLGKMLGFKFPENFKYPYAALSVSDFWRRWHITLSTWFREYVYIPLGGNRVSRGRLVFNLFVTWALTGLWHGASWNYLVWGLYYFVLLTVEKLFLGKYIERAPRAVAHIYTLFFVSVGWLIFAFEDTSAGFEYLKNLFGFASIPLFDLETGYQLVRNFLFFAILVLCALPHPKRCADKLLSGNKSRAWSIVLSVLAVLGFALSVAYLADSSYNPFLYFRF